MALSCVLLVGENSAHAGAKTDGSLGKAGKVKLEGNFIVPRKLGQKVGNNLFFSFEKFSLKPGESATFLGPNSVHNILTRVTGRQRSVIQGEIGSNMPKANFYLMNPNGVVLKGNAALNLSGSFAATTADQLRLKNGGKFNASLSRSSSLTSSPVESYKFLSPTPRPIELNGSVIQVQPEQALSFIGGPVRLNNSVAFAPSGKLSIASAASKGVIPRAPGKTESSRSTPSSYGAVKVENNSIAAIDGTQGGKLVIRSGKLVLVGDSSLQTQNLGDTRGGDLKIQVSGKIDIENGRIFGSALAAGRGGNLVVTAEKLRTHPSLDSDFPSGITSLVGENATGRGGNIRLQVDDIRITAGSEISSYTNGKGAGGDIRIATQTMKLDGKGLGFSNGIFANVNATGLGNAGSIRISAAQIRIVAGSLISSDTLGAGDGGKVKVTARESIVLNGKNLPSFNGLSADVFEGATGNGGKVLLTAPRLEILQGSQISVSVLGTADGGSIRMSGEHLKLDRAGSDFSTGLFANIQSSATGVGGGINLEFDSIRLLGGSAISSNLLGEGKGGDISIKGRSLQLTDGEGNLANGIFASLGLGGKGIAGNIVLKVRDIEIEDAGQIATNLFGRGKGGTISIVGNNLVIDRTGSTNTTISGVLANVQTSGQGQGGDIKITMDSVEILGGSQISASMFGKGTGGKVRITAENLSILRENFVFENGIFASVGASGEGSAGGIRIRSDDIKLVGASQISANTLGSGNGGNISILGKNLMIDRAGSKVEEGNGIFANIERSGEGEGGSIRLTFDEIELLHGSQISVNALGNGNGGDIRIRAENVRIDRDRAVFENGIFARLGVRARGESGSIRIKSDVIAVLGASQISASTLGKGNGGDIQLIGEKLRLDRGGSRFTTANGVFATIEEFARGNGGNIRLDFERIQIVAGSQVSASSKGVGKGGDVRIFADSLTLDRQNSRFENGIFASLEASARGRGGNILIKAEQTHLFGASQISASTSGVGDGGSIQMKGDDLRVDGAPQKDRVEENESGIFATVEARGDGDGGKIQLDIDTISVVAGSQISTNTFGFGNGGNIGIEAKSLYLNGQNSTYSNGIYAVLGSAGEGAGGDIKIDADEIQVLGVSAISASALGVGSGGSVRIKGNSLKVDRANASVEEGNGIFATIETSGVGIGGSIFLEVDQIKVLGGSQISTNTLGNGSSGNITISADKLRVDRRGSEFENGVFASVGGEVKGDGGNIVLKTTELQVLGASQIGASTFGLGNGGNVRVIGRKLVMNRNGSGIEASNGIFANIGPTGRGRGGNVQVSMNLVRVLGGSEISASTSGRGKVRATLSLLSPPWVIRASSTSLRSVIPKLSS